MNLPPESHAYIAQRAQWYFDVATSPRNSPVAFGDNVVFTGNGLRDLNQTIDYIAHNPGCRIICEVGTTGTIMLGNAWPKYLPADIQDVYAIKEAFIAFYGSVDRPSVYRGYGGGAFMASNGTVLLPVILEGTAAGSNSPYPDA